MKRKKRPSLSEFSRNVQRRFLNALKRRGRVDFQMPPCDIRGCDGNGSWMVSRSLDKLDARGRIPAILCCDKHRSYAIRKLRLQSRKSRGRLTR